MWDSCDGSEEDIDSNVNSESQAGDISDEKDCLCNWRKGPLTDTTAKT